MALGLSCPTACGILALHPEIKPTSLVLQGGFLTTGPPGESLSLFERTCIVRCLRSKAVIITLGRPEFHSSVVAGRLLLFPPPLHRENTLQKDWDSPLCLQTSLRIRRGTEGSEAGAEWGKMRPGVKCVWRSSAWR